LNKIAEVFEYFVSHLNLPFEGVRKIFHFLDRPNAHVAYVL